MRSESRICRRAKVVRGSSSSSRSSCHVLFLVVVDLRSFSAGLGDGVVASVVLDGAAAASSSSSEAAKLAKSSVAEDSSSPIGHCGREDLRFRGEHGDIQAKVDLEAITARISELNPNFIAFFGLFSLSALQTTSSAFVVVERSGFLFATLSRSFGFAQTFFFFGFLVRRVGSTSGCFLIRRSFVTKKPPD